MGEVIGELLPLALGVAISPVPIIAVILLLLGPRPRSASAGFLVGWLVGITLVIGVVTLVVEPVDDGDAADPSTFSSVLKMVLGVLAVWLAVKQWRARPRPGEQPELPAWMGAIDSMSAGKAFGLGALLSAANPKNLVLCLGGGVAIGGAGLSTADSVVAVAVFVLLGSCTVAVPVVGYLVASRRMQAPLDDLRVWLAANNATVMAVLLLVIGVVIFGKGLGGL
jgi:threonine/homoserine/homoserine lactone efflux protein